MNAITSTEIQNLPDRDRLSIILASVMLSFTLTNFIEFPVWRPGLQLPGFFISFQVSFQGVSLFLIACLTAVGCDWLIHDHPALEGRVTIPYIVLPAMTIFGIGIPLMQIPFSFAWWIGLFVGSSILALELIGEYITIDVQDRRQPIAAVILLASTFALFLILVTGLHAMQLRLFMLVPAVFGGALLVNLRSLHLRSHGEWLVYESILLAFITSQFSAGLLYWPVSSMQFSLLLVGPTYTLNSLMVGLIEERNIRQLFVEPLIVFLLTIGIVLWIR